MDFSKYAQIKDFYCICYFGYSDEYLYQLKLVRPFIEQSYPGLKIYLGCKDEKRYILENEPQLLSISELRLKRYEFAHIKELKFNGRSHPIEDLLTECKINNCVITENWQEIHTTKCVIVTQGHYPTKPLEKRQIEEIKRRAIKQGYEPVIDESIENAGWVVGVESLPLCIAASKGIRTCLYNTGLGVRLHKTLFPKIEVMDN